MSRDKSADAEQNPVAQKAWSTWLVRELAAAADEPASHDIASESVAKAIAECAELLGHFRVGESDSRRASSAAPTSGEEGSLATDDARTAEDGPRKLDRFEIRRPLGHGGFGVVFLVFDPRLNREAALKIPRPEILISPSLRKRFLREAQATAVLDHPHILPIYETGEIGPVAYILSVYCRGPTLAAWQRDRAESIAPRIAAHIVCNLADAVHHAHSRGILHRDIKPSNVLLEPADEQSAEDFPYNARLTDFGLAKRLDATTEDTQRGGILGTPRYMAPEQAAGDFRGISVQTDVYALGANLYELLTGVPPFVGDSDQDTLRRIQEQEVLPTLLRSRQVDRDLEKICCKCLEKKQADRYPSARDLANDLRRYLAGEPVAARPIGRGERLSRWCRRRPAVAALSLGLITALVLGMTAAGWQWYRAESHLATADKQTALAHEHLMQAENALLDLAWLFEESAFWAPEGMTFRDEVHDKLSDYLRRVTSDSATIDAEVAHRPILAAIHSFSARHAGLAGDAKIAHREFRLALDQWRQLVVEHPDNPGYRRGLSLCLFNFSEFERDWHRAGGTVDPVASARAFYRNIRDDERFGSWSLYDYAQVVLERGNVLFNARRPKEAVEVYRLGLIAVESLLEKVPDDPRYLVCHGQVLVRLAKEQRRLGDGTATQSAASARDSFQRALALEPASRNARVELADTCRMIGIFSRDRKEFAPAEESFARAIQLVEPLLLNPPADYSLQKQLAAMVRELAYVQVNLDKKVESLASFGRCRDLWRAGRERDSLTPEEEKALALACRDEGKLAQELNRSDIARAAFAEGVEAFRLVGVADEELRRDQKTPTRNLLARAECHFYLGRHQAAAGEVDAAKSSLQTVLNLLQPFATQSNAGPPIKDIYAKATSKLEELSTIVEKERVGKVQK